MSSIVFFILKAVAASIIGEVSENWFRKTRLGIWFYNKVSQLLDWASNRYNIALLQKEKKLYKKYPKLLDRISRLEKEVFKDDTRS